MSFAHLINPVSVQIQHARFVQLMEPVDKGGRPKKSEEWKKRRVRENSRRCYQRNKAKRLARNKQWQKDNPEKKKEIYARWWAKNKEKINARKRKDYRLKHGTKP